MVFNVPDDVVVSLYQCLISSEDDREEVLVLTSTLRQLTDVMGGVEAVCIFGLFI